MVFTFVFSVLNNDIFRPNMTDVESTICNGLKRVDSAYWNDAYLKIFESNLTSNNEKLKMGLACHSDKQILMHYLNLNWDSKTSRIPFSKVVTTLLEENEAGVDSVLDFMYKMKADFQM